VGAHRRTARTASTDWCRPPRRAVLRGDVVHAPPRIPPGFQDGPLGLLLRRRRLQEGGSRALGGGALLLLGGLLGRPRRPVARLVELLEL
jgi:hypothetical protein